MIQLPPAARRPLAVAVSALAVLSTAATPPLAGAAPVAPQAGQTLNVQGADIRAFIQDIARSTGRTFIVDPAVSGTVTVSSDRPLSRAQLFEVFLSTLRANGLVVTPTASGAYRISPAAGAAQGPATVGAERFATEVFALRHLDAASAAETIRPLVGPQGQVLANPAGNSVVVADFADNLARIRALIGRIDVDRAAFEVVALDNASAREIAGVLDEVLAGPGGAPGLVTVTPVISSNTLVLRGDPEAVARVSGLARDLDGRAASAQDIQVVFLENADAQQLLPVLQEIVGQPVTATTAGRSSVAEAPTTGEGAAVPAVAAAATPSGERLATVARVPGANALVISASPEMQRTLAEVIGRLDSPRQQVLVEAIVVELTDQALRELGVQWGAAGEDGNPLFVTSYGNSPAPLTAIGGAIAADGLDADDPVRQGVQQAALNSLLTLNGLVGGGGGQVGDVLLGAIVNAVKSDTGSNILSTPSLVTLDNEEAEILVGQEIPITTGRTLLDGQSNPFTTTERQDIGVKLTVRPQINAGGSITLNVRQEVSSINRSLTASATDLVLNKRELENTLVIGDGEIAVAGGLLSQAETLSADRVPVLGDLPGVGALFRSTSRSNERTNLVIFIRPTILRGPADAARVAANRYGQVRASQLAIDPAAEPSIDVLLRDYIRTQPPAAPEPPTGIEGQPIP
ncbi:MAG TPA: type II secretion system secretin GspD [Brevundimonas sp.]|uniref:type II secretion system secretin GspD n=1 Tax=Brevundimonas sp. TaxID=1871086 RepID=UPI002E130F64|nr:type II secretion system secretin GspD [Brevundimonas sp.]